MFMFMFMFMYAIFITVSCLTRTAAFCRNFTYRPTKVPVCAYAQVIRWCIQAEAIPEKTQKPRNPYADVIATENIPFLYRVENSSFIIKSNISPLPNTPSPFTFICVYVYVFFSPNPFQLPPS